MENKKGSSVSLDEYGDTRISVHSRIGRGTESYDNYWYDKLHDRYYYEALAATSNSNRDHVYKRMKKAEFLRLKQMVKEGKI